jgi:formylglycine-generating enzyme required for sulfatase activity
MSAALAALFFACSVFGTTADMVQIPAGEYVPFLKSAETEGAKGQKAPSPPPAPKQIEAFQLDVDPVTVADYLAFVKAHPEWRKSKVKAVFADDGYLRSWEADLEPGLAPRAPITEVSWFAADAYCTQRGNSLPTTDQWEYALHDRGRDAQAVQSTLLKWYSRPHPRRLPAVGRNKNHFGLHDMYGLIWEWTEDFNSASIGEESRDLVCGASAAKARRPSEYATFMRYSFRSSLKAAYTTGALGFRCAREIKKETK